MGVPVEMQASGTRGPLRQAAVYSALAGLAAVTSVGIWLLMIADEDRGVVAATVEMAAKFTNVTVVLAGVVSAWIASGRESGRARAVAHLTVMLMAVVTALVNATLLDPALPGGWWGVADLSQHYVIPVAVVMSWAVLGPRLELSGRGLGLTIVLPLAWFLFVLTRGSGSGNYPYDFIDVAEQGWPSVLMMVSAIVVFMLLLAAGATKVDRRRPPATPARRVPASRR